VALAPSNFWPIFLNELPEVTYEHYTTTVAILGGTGDLGTGLARRWAEAGYRVIIGSRTQEKADVAATELHNVMEERGVEAVKVAAMDNLSAAQGADIIAITVPFSHHTGTLNAVKAALQGKILIDVWCR
jgi:8-hydroxy-5-deazaflavin:NADPH oxidoreductase